MKRFFILFFILSILVLTCIPTFAAPDQTYVQISGDLISTGVVRFVNVGGTSTTAHFSFPADRYFIIDEAYLGDYQLPFDYEGVFIEYQGERYYNQVVFSLNTSNLLEAYSRGDQVFLTVSAPQYSDHDIDFIYISDDGFNLSNASFTTNLIYNELDPLSSQRPLVPYYVNYSDGNFTYLYRFDSAFFTKNFPGVSLTYNSIITFHEGSPFISLKFNDPNNSSLLYNDNVDVKVVYTLVSSSPVGSSTVPGSGSSNSSDDAFYLLSYLSFLGTIPFNVVSPALDIDIFGVNILFLFNLILDVIIIALVVFGIIKVVK